MIAAPFLGEFGWQVALWVPWLRWARQNLYAQRDFTVICHPGHEGLYEDFATEVVPYEVGGITKRDCQLAWMNSVRVLNPAYEIIARHAIGHRVGRLPSVITPLEMKHTWPAGRPPLPDKMQATYHKFGSSKRDEKMIALHARHCEDKQPERDWSGDRWAALAGILRNDGHHLCSIGSKQGSLHVCGSEDMRGLSIKEEVEILSACKLIIGPSSGPLHLANHCGTPAVWWANGLKNLERYETAWNPFHVNNTCVKLKSWQPSPEEVYECLAPSS